MISILGGACAWGLAWIAITSLTNWHPPTEYPFRFHIVAAAIVDRDGVADLFARRCPVWRVAAAADLQDRSK